MAQADVAKKAIAEAKAERDKASAEAAAHTKGHPTPTQSENDLAKMGAPDRHLHDDGSPEERRMMTRSMEGGRAAPYATRTARAAPSSS